MGDFRGIPCPYAGTFAGHIWGVLVAVYGEFSMSAVNYTRNTIRMMMKMTPMMI